jgi:ribonuclease VapC
LPVIVDTSALIAILLREPGSEDLRAVLVDEPARLPAPARVEFLRVASGERLGLSAVANDLLEEFESLGLETVAFDHVHARIAGQANAAFGKGLQNGGTLNLLDLMVYAVARERDEPLLCTGKDFAATDLKLHDASRPN